MDIASFANALQAGVIVLDDAARVLVWNDWVVRRSGIAAVDAANRELGEIFVKLDPRLPRAVNEALRSARSSLLSYALQPFPLPLTDPDSGEPIRQSIVVSPLPAAGARGVMVQITDVSDTVRRERLLRDQADRLKAELEAVASAKAAVVLGESRFHEIARQAPVGIYEFDTDGRCVFVNDRWCQMTGLTAAQADGRGWVTALHPEDAPKVARSWREALAQRSRFEAEFRYRDASGHILWVRSEAAPLFAADGALRGYIGTATDITHAKQQALLAEFRASHDSLTGLPNRSVLEHRVRGAIEEARSAGSRCAVLFIDLDRFKQVNDELGHDIGDRVLQVSSERLRNVVRSGDLVARWGGDEFVIVLGNVAAKDSILRVARDIEQRLVEPIDLGGIVTGVGCSVGVAIYPDDASSAEALTRMADSRMYAIKRTRQGN